MDKTASTPFKTHLLYFDTLPENEGNFSLTQILSGRLQWASCSTLETQEVINFRCLPC